MASARKTTGSGGRTSRRKKRQGLFGFKTCALLLLAGAAAALVFYVRSGGSLKELGRVLPPGLRLEGGPEPESASWQADIFFSDTDTASLVAEKRTLPRTDGPEQRARQLMAELLRGPSGAAVRTTPETAVLRSVVIGSDGTARVDFSAALAGDHPGGSASEMLTVYSIVNTLALNVDDIKKVQILIEGRPADTIAGHMDCSQPFAPNIKIIK